MNAADQRLHTRKTDQLAQVIVETQGAVVERFEEMEASFAAMADKVTEARMDLATLKVSLIQTRTELAAERTARLNLRQDFYASWHHTTCWGRLRWLVTGR